MAIQFFCTACGQPIEVDDDAGGLPVTCPYCRTVVQAARDTDPGIGPHPMTLQSEGGVSPGVLGEPAESTLRPLSMLPLVAKGNPVAWSALICGAVAVLLYVVTTAIIVLTIRDHVDPRDQEALQAFMREQQTNPHPRLRMAVGAMCLGSLSSIAGVVTGILGLVNRRSPRWPAVLGLVLSTGVVILSCLGAIIQVMQAAGRAGAAGG